jgi:UDP-N-acetyl-D-mannosaminuronic acid dehydrogenase
MIVLERSVPLDRALKGMADDARATESSALIAVVDDEGRLCGVVADSDVRRHLAADGALTAPIGTVMRHDPIAFAVGTPLDAILRGLPSELARTAHRSRHLVDKVVLVDEDRIPRDVVDLRQLLEQRVAVNRHVVIIGLGYVGLTLALVMAELGFRVTGVDNDEGVVATLLEGRSHVHEQGLPDMLLRQLGKQFQPTTTMPEDGDVFIIAVGTPFPAGADAPDLSALEASCVMVAQRLRRGGLVILRSTVPVGTTRQVVAPLLAAGSGLEAGTGFHLAFAPERTVEGSALQELRTLPQLIGGLTLDSLESTAALLREVSPVIVRTSTPEVAELAKLTNNAYRDVTFAFANQVARIGGDHDVDAFEAIRAANQGYPRGQVPLPSPGVGGPCLTKDPLILAHSLAGTSAAGDLLSVGRAVNAQMPTRIAQQVVRALGRGGVDPAGARAVVSGLAFKGEPETGDLRDSPGVDVARSLQALGLTVVGTDEVAAPEGIEQLGIEAGRLPSALVGAHVLLVVNNHRSHQNLPLPAFAELMGDAPILFDGWGLYQARDVLAAGFACYLSYGVERWSSR